MEYCRLHRFLRGFLKLTLHKLIAPRVALFVWII